MTTTSLSISLTTATEEVTRCDDRRRRLALLVVAVAFVLDLMDASILTIGLPTIQRAMHASSAAVNWMAAGYPVSFSVFLILGGRLGDRFGYRRLFVLGVTGFALSSLAVAVAPSPGALIAARLVQGTTAALMVPQVLSFIQVLFRPEERTKIFGMLGGLGMMATTTAPIATALLIRANVAGLSWRPVFLINIPICLVGIGLALRYLPAGGSSRRQRLDVRGTALAVVAMGSLVVPLVEGHDLHWPTWSVAVLLGSVPLLVAFVRTQLHARARGRTPIVLPELFEHRSFSLGLVISGLLSVSVGCFALTFTLMMQVGHHFTPIHAVLTALFITAGIVPTAGALSKSVVPALGRYALTLGALTIAGGVGLVDWTIRSTSLSTWQVAPGLVLIGIGMALCFTSLLPFVLSSVDPRDAGSASGIANAVQQVGGALGIALAGVAFFSHVGAPATYLNAFGIAARIEIVLLAAAALASVFMPRRLSPEAYEPRL